MLIISDKTRWFAANGIFPSLFLGVLGLFLGQAWGAQVGGSWQLHALVGVPGLALSVLVFYRARIHWSAGIVDMRERERERRPSLITGDLLWYVMLFGGGIVIALSAMSPLLITPVALLTYLVPWTKIPVCRTHFVISLTIMLAGAITFLAFSGKPAHPLQYLIAEWMVSFISMVMLFAVLFSLPYGYRVRELAQVENPSIDKEPAIPQPTR
jgi:hypothetical protein